MKNKVVTLLTWCSENHDPDVLKNVINDLQKKNEKIDKIYYLYQPNQKKKINNIRMNCECMETICIELENPTDHKKIYDEIKNKVLPLVKDNENLVINISPGTPAMHAVWLLLFAGGVFSKKTRLVSSQFDKKKNITFVDDVDFPITTYLSELREFERENPNEPVYESEAKSQARRDALEQIKVYAGVQGVPMLLLGERGIGKSSVVESFVSTIKKKDVVTVACGSLDSTLAESTMFGHKKGAFTGAIENHKGLLDDARGKILFLDEIQDLPKSVQRKLVRTLQDKHHRYRPLGASKEETADIELVCASNLSEKELKEKLDSDFYDRISFYKVELPPLRECREDLLDDWREVWKSSRLDSSPENAPEDDCLMKFFKKSSLPGNFRNLQSVAYQIIAWNGKKSMEEILKDIYFENVANKELDIADYPELQNKKWSEATKLFQRSLAKYFCEKCGTQAEAAKKLGCTTKTLQNAMK